MQQQTTQQQSLSTDKHVLPSNTELISSLERLRKTLGEQRQNNPEVDERGKAIASAIEDFLSTSQSFVSEKNWDDLFQKFADHVKVFAQHAHDEAKSKGLLDEKTGQIKGQFYNLGANLKRVIQQLFTSTETRNIFREIEGFLETITESLKQAIKEKRKMADLSDDVKNDLVKRQAKLLAKIGSTPSAKDMRSDFLALFDYWNGTNTDISPQLQNEFSQLFSEAICIVERVSEADVKSIEQNVKSLYREFKADEEASKFFTDARNWSENIVNNPGLADDSKVLQEGRQNMDRGMRVLDRFGERMQTVLNQLNGMLKSLQQERHLGQGAREIKQVGKTLTKGSLLDTAVQLRALLIPVINKEMMQEVKLPRIQDTDEKSSWTLDNLRLKGKDIKLEDISLKIKVGLKDILRLSVVIKNIQVDFKGVEFTYEHTGIPSWSDKGVFDCRLQTPVWKLVWMVKQEKGQTSFVIAETKGRVKKIDIDIIQAEHKLIDSILIPMWMPVIRAKTQSAIESSLRSRAKPLTENLNKFFSNPQDAVPFFMQEPTPSKTSTSDSASATTSASTQKQSTQAEQHSLSQKSPTSAQVMGQ